MLGKGRHRITLALLESSRTCKRISFLQNTALHALILALVTIGILPELRATPLSMVQTASDLWSSLATRAAKETIAAVRKSSQVELDFQTVPMETFQVCLKSRNHEKHIL